MTDPRLRQHMDGLRRALIARRSATRAQLAWDTGLSAMTVGKLLGRMQDRGEVRQDETVASGGGRPSMLAEYKDNYAHLACVSVTQKARQNAFSFGIWDIFGNRVHSSSRVIDDVGEESFDFFLREAREAGYRIRLVVFALPGEAQGDRVLLSDFATLVGDSFLPGVRRRFHVRTLFENDVNAAIFGHEFAQERPEICAGLYFPGRFAPGAGAVANGQILRGHRHFAGEIAHMHGFDTWVRAQEEGDEEKIALMTGMLLKAYACILAPGSMVIYEDFFSPALRTRLCEEFDTHFGADFDMQLEFSAAPGEDMEKGAALLGREALLRLLNEQDT